MFKRYALCMAGFGLMFTNNQGMIEGCGSKRGSKVRGGA